MSASFQRSQIDNLNSTMVTLGKSLILLGAVIVVVGLVILFAPKIPYIGKLPGDIHLKRGNFEFYFPLATSIVISVILSGIVWFISHGSKK